ncbi:MAG: glycoside hydrolase family 92 protein [Clostridiales bacterium]|nr:glycoside hydrolase family 92 protein [Clostridiales bacterium]
MPNGKEFEISKTGRGICVEKAYLNDEELNNMSIKASEMMKGGRLCLIMCDKAIRDPNNFEGGDPPYRLRIS